MSYGGNLILPKNLMKLITYIKQGKITTFFKRRDLLFYFSFHCKCGKENSSNNHYTSDISTSVDPFSSIEFSASNVESIVV